MTKREIALDIIEQRGACFAYLCSDCPLNPCGVEGEAEEASEIVVDMAKAYLKTPGAKP